MIAIPIVMVLWFGHLAHQEHRAEAQRQHYIEQLPPTCRDPKTALEPWNYGWCKEVSEEIARKN